MCIFADMNVMNDIRRPRNIQLSIRLTGSEDIDQTFEWWRHCDDLVQ